ncbi:MAG TPA: glycosyltransferase family 4 protein [Candidatus Paceibacterota bacterium]|nr:glycosyltransferase family 4 protein [Candidatus Paceibacterota bacterium]
MRLVIATPLYPPEIGGPATYAKLLVEGLPARGIKVDLVKFSDVRHLPKVIRHFAYFRRVRKAAKSADAVLALDPVSVGLPAMKAAKRVGKPFLVKIVGDYAWEQGQQRFGITQTLDEFVKTFRVPFPVRLFRRIQTYVARSAVKVVVPSEYLKSIVAKWGILEDKIQVVYNAVPLEEFGVVPEAVAKLPRPLTVTAGRLVPWKHIDGIIDAIADIPEASLAVVGDGPLRVPLARHMREKLPGRATLTGMLSHKDTLAVVRSADIFVLNSSYEGLSHLLVEALALGMPIVATRVGGNPEVITDGEDGLLVRAGDMPALARSLSRLLSDEVLCARFSAHAVESAKRFSVETMLDTTAMLLKMV